MGEIDTKSIKSVQSSLSLFGEKCDQRKNRSDNIDELERVKELEDLLKDLANYKIQLEAKDSVYKQALLKLDHYQKLANENTTLLKNSELEKDIYINECKEGRMQIKELESKIKEMLNQLCETEKIVDQLSLVTSELRTAQEAILSIEAEIAAARDAKVEALTQAELMETELLMEKEKTEELLRHVSELNEAILHARLAAVEAEKEKCAILLEKEAEIELAATKAFEAEEKIEYMGKQLEVMQDLESQLMAKTLIIDSLKVELNEANELHSLSVKAASAAIGELNERKSDLELLERKNRDQMGSIELLEMELNQLKLELENAKEGVHRLNSDAESTRGELEKAKTEMQEILERETEAQVEIAMLKSELHRGRSRVAAAEAVEVRVKSEKSGLYLAVQELAIEAEDAKKESRRLNEAAGKAAQESDNSVIVHPQGDKSPQEVQLSPTSELEAEGVDEQNDTNARITMSKEEYEALLEKVEKADKVPEPQPENTLELETLKKDLETATVKVGEFRTRAEQAMARAEAAERGKAVLEDRIRKWREQREKRKAAIAALREDSFPPEESTSFARDPPTPNEQKPKTYQPLSKILNMEF